MARSPVLLFLLFFLCSFNLALCQNASVAIAQQDRSDGAAAFAQLQQHFHQKTDDEVLAGTVILLAQGQDTWLDVYGKRVVESGAPMEENTIFRLASMTKPIVSTAVMMLVEQGRLNLHDPLEQFIPAFGGVQAFTEDGTLEKLRRSITVQDLLTHTGGIANTLFRNTPAERAYAEAFKNKHPNSLQELVDMLAELPLAHHPGEGWTYGYSTDILARIVEITSGETIDAFLKAHIFLPLKMEDTGFQVPEERLSRFAAAYGKGLKRVDGPDGNSPYTNSRNFPRGAGGLVSTAQDYLRFCQMLLNGGTLDGVRLLRAETVGQMMQNQLPEGILPHTPGMPAICNGFGLAFGIQTDEPFFGKPGDCAWPGAFLTYFFISPSNNGIGILMTQCTDFSNLSMLGEFHEMAARVFASTASEASGAGGAVPE
ncbi:MAG: beta-lactamase family protein [Phaeodactylibacter sp.]|nr:beta-lactamase family protein [Phaeodactylibacter sp.]MCB9054172.1 beta-lactamase family protein [Lewinellaceae bacterium]